MNIKFCGDLKTQFTTIILNICKDYENFYVFTSFLKTFAKWGGAKLWVKP